MERGLIRFKGSYTRWTGTRSKEQREVEGNTGYQTILRNGKPM